LHVIPVADKLRSELENALQTPAGHTELLQELKARIRTAQVRAAFAVSRELILLYWSIGREILTRQDAQGWGAKIVERLAHDLQVEFPGVESFSARSLKYMRAFAAAWPEESIVQQLVAQLTWGHNIRVLDRIKDRPTREWYLRAALEDLSGPIPHRLWRGRSFSQRMNWVRHRVHIPQKADDLVTLPRKMKEETIAGLLFGLCPGNMPYGRDAPSSLR
jgi:predicted nuclease of restriction endonuclease-like (RecB) superfamily